MFRNKNIFHTTLSISFLFLIQASYGQDTLKVTKKEEEKISKRHSPAAATILSACVPGLGQVYNKKYWKPPIIYAAIGTTYYFFHTNNILYKQFTAAYVYRTDTATATVDDFPEYSPAQLQELSTYYRRYRDLNVILMALFYTLNVADAYVDAHLITFDISDNLSMTVLPNLDMSFRRKNPTAGLTLSFRF